MSATRVRFGHCSPNTPALDLWVDGVRSLTDVAYETIDDDVELDEGTHSFAVTPVGKQRTDALCTAEFDFDANRAHTVLLVGEFDDAELAHYEDAHPDETTPGATCRVRVLHCSPATPPVDVAVGDGQVRFEEVDFATVTEYASLDAGSYDLHVRLSEADADDDPLLELLDVRLFPGTACTLFVVGTREELDLLTRRDAEFAFGEEPDSESEAEPAKAR